MPLFARKKKKTGAAAPATPAAQTTPSATAASTAAPPATAPTTAPPSASAPPTATPPTTAAPASAAGPKAAGPKAANPKTADPADLTKAGVIARNPELKAFYDAYEKLPLAPTEGEGSKYKTPEDFKKLTNSAVKPPTRDTSTHLTEGDKTAVELDKTTLGEQFRKKKLTADEQKARDKKIKDGTIIPGPDKSILKTIGEKLLDILNSVGAAVTSVNVKEIIDAGKAVKDAEGAGGKFKAIVDLGFVLVSAILGFADKVSGLIETVNKICTTIRLPIISSIIGLLSGIWDWIKSAQEIKRINRRAKFLNDKQNAFKKKRFDDIVKGPGPKPVRKPITKTQVAAITPETDVAAIKDRQKRDLKIAEEKRKKDREQRKVQRALVLEERLKGVTDPKKRKEIEKEMKEETLALRKMRKEGREVAKREGKQELKDAKMLQYSRDHSGESELRRKSRFIFFDRGDGTKEDDYELNDDKLRADVFAVRGKATRTGDEEKQLEESEEIIANYRAQDVLQTKLRGQIVSIISTGFSVVGEGINLVAELTGVEIPVGSVVSGAGTVLKAGNAAIDKMTEVIGNFDDTTQGKRYLDRSSEINLVLRKTDETRVMDEGLDDTAKGPEVEGFSKKYWETKKYIHAYGIDMKEAADKKKNPTKYHVVKYMMDAVAEV